MSRKSYSPTKGNTMKIIHLRRTGTNGPRAKGGVTVVYAQIEGGYLVTAAGCTNTDRFCKARGREIALGRWEKVESRTFIPCEDDVSIQQALREYAGKVLHLDHTKAWASCWQREALLRENRNHFREGVLPLIRHVTRPRKLTGEALARSLHPTAQPVPEPVVE
jgi:hypothetical protein